MRSEFDKWNDAFKADAAGRTGPLVAAIRESTGVIPPYAIERLAYRLELTPIRKKSGRKETPRDGCGATPYIAKLCDMYERYYDLIGANVPANQAEAEARRIYVVSDEQWLKLIRNGNTRAVAVLRKRGALRSKRSPSNIPGAYVG
ncbi:hypothetical protein [Bradyrhizobium sp. BWC-3-1]|uniref:hypothetical protein n=1 Tax=Bradyrhizobium sp. BWC-3-1 TaxID=3080012 RepID=UPI00293F6E5F|nr:hypothetical protein [Bradyrhizobium sp. BWC-3-1]WOH59458.1 hypothetical protein RX329_04855 [Bradyrhizobium sp. BWC-3-1]